MPLPPPPSEGACIRGQCNPDCCWRCGSLRAPPLTLTADLHGLLAASTSNHGEPAAGRHAAHQRQHKRSRADLGAAAFKPAAVQA